MDERLPRKLAAILYADVAGYSRLTGEDEDATHRALRDYLDLIASTIDTHRGQVMHYAGDAVLAKFTAVVDAMSAAVAIQDELQARNEALPDERKVRFRIGVNSGDVIEDRGDMYGDGVNVAARLETLAEPGGICISESVRIAIGKKLDLDYEDLGEQQVKNIAEPVRVHKVVMEDREQGAITSPGTPTLELPDIPSIAVLPFTNMSGDPEQEYFSDGITEDIITELSRFGEFHVVSRTSAFVYKKKPVKVQDVGRELKVRYVLEGSVRRAGDRVRVIAQLVDATTGGHVWAERYDRMLEDIFAVQDEVTRKIVATLAGQLEATERQRVRTDVTKNLQAYDYLLRGREIWHRFTPESNREARRLYEKAIELDPNYVRAYTSLGWTHIVDYREAWTDSPDVALNDALEVVKKGIEVNPTSHSGYLVLGHVQLLQAAHEDAIETFEKAVALNPNDADSYVFLARAFIYAGNAHSAMDLINTAMELNPNYPNWYRWTNGVATFVAQQYEEAIAIFRKIQSQDDRVYRWLAASYGQAGYEMEAKAVAEIYLRRNPHFSFAHHRKTEPFKKVDDLERYLSGLRKAGLSD